MYMPSKRCTQPWCMCKLVAVMLSGWHHLFAHNLSYRFSLRTRITYIERIYKYSLLEFQSTWWRSVAWYYSVVYICLTLYHAVYTHQRVALRHHSVLKSRYPFTCRPTVNKGNITIRRVGFLFSAGWSALHPRIDFHTTINTFIQNLDSCW